MGFDLFVIRTAVLVTVILSLIASFYIYGWALGTKNSMFRLEGRWCRSVAKEIPEPYSLGYQLRDQVIDLDGVQYAAYKWDGPIERQDFDKAVKAPTVRIRFKIYDSKLYVNATDIEFKHEYAKEHFIKVIDPLLMALHLYRIPNMDFLVELDDGVGCKQPIFTYSINTECAGGGGFAFPSYGAYGATMGEKQLNFLFECMNFNYPYNKRIPKGVWRGSTTGPLIGKDTYMKNRRVRLSRMAQNLTDIMDVGLYAYVQMGRETKDVLKEVVPLVPRIEMEDYSKYAVTLDMDGNGWSDRLSILISYNTPVLKQTSKFQEYFGHMLQDGVNIETFNETLADVVPRLQELLREYKASPKRLQRMAEAMHKVALDHGSHLGMIRAVAYGLTVYASKLTWKTEMESGLVEINKTECCRNPTFPARFVEAVRAG